MCELVLRLLTLGHPVVTQLSLEALQALVVAGMDTALTPVLTAQLLNVGEAFVLLGVCFFITIFWVFFVVFMYTDGRVCRRCLTTSHTCLMPRRTVSG